jgi:hypothetical protein
MRKSARGGVITLVFISTRRGHISLKAARTLENKGERLREEVLLL